VHKLLLMSGSPRPATVRYMLSFQTRSTQTESVADETFPSTTDLDTRTVSRRSGNVSQDASERASGALASRWIAKELHREVHA